MQIAEQFNGESYYAIAHELTTSFMSEYLELCKKHKVAIVPVDSDHSVDFHDGMRVIPLTDEVQEYIENTTICIQ